MTAHTRSHPGALIERMYLEEQGISIRAFAERLGVTHDDVVRLVVGQSSITPNMATRLARVLGSSPESWLQLQINYDEWASIRWREAFEECIRKHDEVLRRLAKS